MHNLPSSDRRRSVTLIGMAGVGKSTVGQLLAQRLGRQLIDTDDQIRQATGQSLQALIQSLGLDSFLKKEDAVISSLVISDAVIATGGSVIYGKAAMAHLKLNSWVVWLQQDSAMLKQRIGDSPQQRGLAIRPGQSIEDVIAERAPLYALYADEVIHCGSQSPEEIVEAISVKYAL